jgi:hypothetical protein
MERLERAPVASERLNDLNDLNHSVLSIAYLVPNPDLMYIKLSERNSDHEKHFFRRRIAFVAVEHESPRAS